MPLVDLSHWNHGSATERAALAAQLDTALQTSGFPADVVLEPDQVGMGAHTHHGIVTVLWADPLPSLQILGGDGACHPVQHAPDALLVNLGDALARWTNDQWISTMHRVAAPRVDGELVPRRSAAYFHDGTSTRWSLRCRPASATTDRRSTNPSPSGNTYAPNSPVLATAYSTLPPSAKPVGWAFDERTGRGC